MQLKRFIVDFDKYFVGQLPIIVCIHKPQFFFYFVEWPEFMRPIQTPPSKSPVNMLHQHQNQNQHHHQHHQQQLHQQNQHQMHSQKSDSPKTTPRLLPLGSAACVTYNRVPWLLRVRKEVFSPAEPIGPPSSLHMIFCQIAGDVFGITACMRITSNEKRAGVSMLSGYGVTAENLNSPHRANIKRSVIELARTWPLYFARLFPVSGAAQVSIFFF